MSLRQRRTGTGLDEPTESNPSSTFVRRVRQVDFFPKPKEDYQRVQTPTGGAVSFAASVLIGLLITSEVIGYAIGRNGYSTKLSVDTGVKAAVPINFDITFFSIPCGDLSIDVMDATGVQENDVNHDLYKSPVNVNGDLVFRGKFNFVQKQLGPDGVILKNVANDPRKDPKSPLFCGNCYIQPVAHHHGYDKPGGLVDTHLSSVHKDSCCNTCEAVMKMYDMHRLPRPHDFEVEQCITELSKVNPGCNLRGTLHLRKSKGNFHLAPGTTAIIGPGGQHIHQFTFEQLLRFNVSHRINHLSIGSEKVSRFGERGVIFPLDGYKYIVQVGQGLIKYFLKVVPATYSNGDWTGENDETSSFEFSTQVHHSESMFGDLSRTPSLFFVFDFEPIQVNHQFRRPHFGHFVVKLCCMVGGIFVVMGLVDRMLGAYVAYVNRSDSSR